ncbi:MAG: TonB-dependent receptor [Gemmatimonadales bacterium]|nr:TonB-dependent receptor [Gemmatimonadales bacterium]
MLASPKLGARYLIGSRVALLGSLSRGFRGAVGVIGDPSRPPVVAWAKEVGATYSGDRLHAQMALFQLDVSNERLQDPVTREVSDAGRSRRRGVSLDLALTAAPGLRLIAEGTFNDAEMTAVTPTRGGTVVPSLSPVRAGFPLRPSFHDVPLAPGDRVPGVSKYFGRAGVEAVLSSAVESRALLRFSGPFTPIGEPGVRTQAYGVLDVGASLRLRGMGGVLDLDLLNLLDVRYPELRASGYLNPGAPRTVRAAMRFGGES